jgi:hypothetical protein
MAIVPRLRLSSCLAFGVILSLALVGCGGSATTLPPSGTPAPTATRASGGAPTATPVGSTSAGPIGLCTALDLEARLTPQNGQAWDATVPGYRSAVFSLQNLGSATCKVRAVGQVLLVNGDGKTLITGGPAPSSQWLQMAPDDILKTTVRVGNLCTQATITAPLRVVFIMPDGGGTIIAVPAGPTDVGADTGCSGDPGTLSGSIDMQAWAP